MKVCKFLLSMCLLTTTCMARMTPADIQEEIGSLNALQRQALQILQPIQDNIDAVKREVRAPFEAEAQPINAQLEALRQEINAMQSQCYELENKFRPDSTDLDKKEQLELQEATAPLESELEAKRQPIMAEVEELRARERKILQDCYRMKAHPVWGKWWDGMDSLDVGLKCGFIAEQIRKLYVSVDGELPARIEETRRTVRDKYYAERSKRGEEIDAAKKEISGRMREKEVFLEDLQKQTSAVYQRQREAIDAIAN